MNTTEGYYISESEGDLGQCLVLTAPWRNDLVQLMVSQGITVLRLSSSAGWKEHDISFVANLDFLVGLEVYSWNVKDVSPIFKNTELRYVGIQCDISYIADFKTLKNLEICKLTWRPKVIGLETCVKLRHLNISDYPNEDLINLAALIRLERLQISSSKLISLNGIESMSLLKVFDAAICRKLADISSLAACTALEVMEFHSCKQFSELPKNICTDNLREVTLVDCGNVKSLSPLVNCKNLRKLRFIGDTSILDGNLDFLLKHPSIRDVWYAKKSHYSVTREDLKVHLELNLL